MPAWIRIAFFILLAVAGAGLLLPGDHARSQTSAGELALQADIEGVIGPATTKYVEEVMGAARERDADLVLLRINTPGGLATSMRQIIEHILSSDIPVAGYVSPSGAHAASAGTYILYATGVAAMAPGTNLGAATPVQIGGGIPGMPSPEKPGENKGSEPSGSGGAEAGKEGGGETSAAPSGEDSGQAESTPGQPDEPMSAKAVNDAVAFIRSLAELHGRNADWAEKAVREAASLSAKEAEAQGVIDLVTPNVSALLTAIDGRTVKTNAGDVVLETKGLRIEKVEPSFVTKALGILANPNVAFLLMMVGIYGLIFEFANPGTIGPGIIGAICLVLGLYALNQLPLDYAGLALVVLGVALMIAEAVTPAFGVLGTGGLVSFVIGASFLFDTDIPAYQLSWEIIAGTAIVSGLILVLLVGYLWRTYRRPVVSGVEEIVGANGRVVEWSGSEGFVFARGERWKAYGPDNLEAGETVRIEKLEGLRLQVTREAGAHPAASDTTSGART